MTEAAAPSPDHIPVCEPWLDGNELAYATDALRSGWISSSGEYLGRFERGFAAYCGARHGVAATSGTAALHLALAACGIGSGDEVIVPAFTMIATAFAVCYTGALPVFVDAEPATWTMDVEKVEAKLTVRTKAIVAVHVYGHPTDMDPLRELAAWRGIRVIEDAAEAHGSLYKGRRCGSLADIAAFSFYANKIITTGEGGMVVTSDDALADAARRKRNLGFPTSGPRTYRHLEIGFNYRMSNVQAAIGLAQLEKIDQYVEARRANAARYDALLAGVNAITRPIERPWARNTYWMYGILVQDGAPIERDELLRCLAIDGIETRPFFVPMHLQPALREYGADCSGDYPVAAQLAERGLCLPSGSNLSPAQLERVCERVAQHCST